MNMQKIALASALAATVALPLAASAAPNDWRGYGNGSYGSNGGYNGNSRLSGTIASVNGGAVTLQNGRTVFLKSDTNVNGGGLSAGERIAVIGTDAGNGNINARTISILGNGYNNGGYSNGGYNNGDNDGYGRSNEDNEGNGNRRRRHHHHNGERNENQNGERHGNHGGDD